MPFAEWESIFIMITSIETHVWSCLEGSMFCVQTTPKWLKWLRTPEATAYLTKLVPWTFCTREKQGTTLLAQTYSKGWTKKFCKVCTRKEMCSCMILSSPVFFFACLQRRAQKKWESHLNFISWSETGGQMWRRFFVSNWAVLTILIQALFNRLQQTSASYEFMYRSRGLQGICDVAEKFVLSKAEVVVRGRVNQMPNTQLGCLVHVPRKHLPPKSDIWHEGRCCGGVLSYSRISDGTDSYHFLLWDGAHASHIQVDIHNCRGTCKS